MRNIISVEQLKESKTYHTLDKARQYILSKRETRSELTNIIQVYKNTGSIQPHIIGYKRQVIIDLIELNNHIDASFRMTSEDIKLYNV